MRTNHESLRNRMGRGHCADRDRAATLQEPETVERPLAAFKGSYTVYQWLRSLLGSAAVTALVSTVCADTLRLPTGEVLIGRVLEQNSTTINFESKALGRLSVPAAGVDVQRDGAGIPATAAPASPPPAAPSASGAVARAEPAEPQSWVRQALHLPPAFNGSFDFGANIMNADVRMREYMVEAAFGWKGEQNEFQTFHAYENVTVNGVRAANTHDEGARWIRHLAPRWMLLSQVDWRHDENQGIDYRFDVIAVPAYYFIKTDRFSVLAGAGPSYEWRKWIMPGSPGFSRFNAAAYEVLRFKVTKTLAFRQTFLGYVDPKNNDDYRYVFDVNLRQRLTPGLSLSLSYNRRHDSQPAPRAVEDQDRVVTKVGYEF